ncbi:RNA binding protein fox-1 homolog 3 isoform X4 [Lingula anatina]|uniref:RNA binding protein fox-1 homolog 3 isoform X4 n=1 Tax=Lingula anatina TaxID=7574 RepID=A0A1S3IMU4_LINAN|nr:RNA binding protein fox-1 homolog 3 isoform X4 [Lingula anatina]|eukprot:XP_013399216.1 RNA binding protein fox-1 homolog 3 isoform X4 [Lingula anatina]
MKMAESDCQPAENGVHSPGTQLKFGVKCPRLDMSTVNCKTVLDGLDPGVVIVPKLNGLDTEHNNNKTTTDQQQTKQHMVQNQMTPTYPAYSQASLPVPEEFTQPQTVVTSTADQTQTVPFSTSPLAQNGVEQQTVSLQTDLDNEVGPQIQGAAPTVSSNSGPKRLHVSNIPFRFREADLRQLLGQFGPILDVEIIFNERGSKGFGFVTFQNSADAERAREKLNGTVVEGRKIEVNNATARIMTKKSPTAPVIPNGEYMYPVIPNAAALRGAALTRGRIATVTRGAYTAAAAAAAAAAFRAPQPVMTAQATALPYPTAARSVYQDPFGLAASAQYASQAAAAERYAVTSLPYATAAYAGTAAARYALPTMGTAAGGVTYTLSGYTGREYAADPYLGHTIGPVTGYGGQLYRAGYQRFAPY